jgi:hypothetical protein
MGQTPLAAIQAIQAILAPALGISAVGLLLLALNSRYSTIVNRIRLLNDEKRRFHKMITENTPLNYSENARYHSIRSQTEGLLMRSRLVRNAILSFQFGVALFVVTSVTIGLSFFMTADAVPTITLILFEGGMICVLVGILYAGLEITRSFRIVLIEVNAEE